MKKILLLLFVTFFGIITSYAQDKANQEKQFARNVVTFKSQDFVVRLDRWVNYPNDLGAKQEVMRDVKIEFTPEGVTVNLPIINRVSDKAYSIGKEGAYKVFDFKNENYEIVSSVMNKANNQYKAVVKINDPNDSGMTMDFIFYKNGSVQIVANCTNFERTIFIGSIFARLK